MIAAIEYRIRLAVRRTMFGVVSGLMLVIGIGFLAAAGWIALAQVMDHLEIALIYGGVFVGLGLIFLALTRTKRAAVTMAPSVNAPASTVAPAAGIAAFGGLSAAFVQGISAGTAAGRGTPPDDEHDHLH
jgi:hypothetical protein